MNPIDYTQLQVQPDVYGGILQGQKDKLLLDAAKQQQAQQQQEQERLSLYRQQLSDYFAAPSPDKLLQIQTMFPEQSKAFEPLVKRMSEKQLQSELSAGMQISNMLGSGNVDGATKLLDTHIEGVKNAGGDPTSLINIKQAITSDPKNAKAYIDFTVANIMGADKFKNYIDAKNATEEEKRKADLFPIEKGKAEAAAKEAAAKAVQAETEAKYADANAQLNLMDKKSQIEYRKKQTEIATLNAAIAREGNALKRQELQIQLAQKQQDFSQKVQEKQADFNAQLTSTDNMLDTIYAIKNTNKSVQSRSLGPLASRAPTLTQGGADFEANIDTLKSQVFLNQVRDFVGKGALSDAEGKKINESVQNLSMRQSPEQFNKNLNTIELLLMKGRTNLGTRYGMKVPKYIQPIDDNKRAEILNKYLVR